MNYEDLEAYSTSQTHGEAWKALRLKVALQLLTEDYGRLRHVCDQRRQGLHESDPETDVEPPWTEADCEEFLDSAVGEALWMADTLIVGNLSADVPGLSPSLQEPEEDPDDVE